MDFPTSFNVKEYVSTKQDLPPVGEDGDMRLCTSTNNYYVYHSGKWLLLKKPYSIFAERIRKMLRRDWSIWGYGEVTHKHTGKCYSLNTILFLPEWEFERFLDSNCIYDMSHLPNYKEEQPMIFNDNKAPTPTPERIALHITDVNIHKANVANFINTFVTELNDRAVTHDASKFSPEEMDYYAHYTPELRGLTYGSQEYKDNLELMKPAIDNHYHENSHHPEHYDDGIAGMDLVDLMEMLADWKAATMRHDNGDRMKSMEINKKRFGIDDQLQQILMNTVQRYIK